MGKAIEKAVPEAPNPVSDAEAGTRGWLWIAGATYTALYAVTGARLMGDSVYYASDILRGANTLEPGHLAWRAAGRAVHGALAGLGATSHFEVPELRVLTALVCASAVAGLVAVVALAYITAQAVSSRLAAGISVVGFASSFAFLNYTHSGTPYAPALAFLVLAMALMCATSTHDSRARRILAGLMLAASVCCWLPFVFAVPAALLLPGTVQSGREGAVRRAVLPAVTFAAVAATVFALAGAAHGARDVSGYRDWFAASSHGVTHTSGVARATVGLPRSFITMGDDGALLKRYVTKDPYNPVSASEVFRGSVLRAAGFYAVCLMALTALLSKRAERPHGLVLLAASIPVVLSGIVWQGGDIERYISLSPFVFLALAVAASSRSRSRLVRPLTVAYTLVALVANVADLGAPRLAADADRHDARIAALAAVAQPNDLVVTLNGQDPLFVATHNRPFSAAARAVSCGRIALITKGTSTLPHWRQGFASHVLSAWERGGDVWLAARITAATPAADWHWADNDDPRVRWTDVRTFISGAVAGPEQGGPDGWRCLRDTARNTSWLRRWCVDPPSAGRAKPRRTGCASDAALTNSGLTGVRPRSVLRRRRTNHWRPAPFSVMGLLRGLVCVPPQQAVACPSPAIVATVLPGRVEKGGER